MIRPQLTHVGIYVKDMEIMQTFYAEVFGLAVTDQGTRPDFHLDITFLSASPGEHHQLVLVGGREDDANANVAQQISFVVASLDEVREMRDRVVAAGAEVRRQITHGNAWSVYFGDPEGNTIEVYAHTPWYIRQPAAIPFDLDQTNDEIMAWTETLCRSMDGFTDAGTREAEMRRLMDN